MTPISDLLLYPINKYVYVLAFVKNACFSYLIIIIIIISLFQEDNIFGTNASLTYGPRLQR